MKHSVRRPLAYLVTGAFALGALAAAPPAAAADGPVVINEFLANHDGTDVIEYVELLSTWDPLESTCRHASLSIL